MHFLASAVKQSKMRVHRRPVSLPLLFILTTSLVVSTAGAVPSKAPLNSGLNKRVVRESPAAPRHTRAANDGLVLSPAASLGNNSFADLKAVYLWTRSHASDASYESLNPNLPETITSSSFLPSSKTYLLLHGFLDRGTAPWILQLKAKLLHLEDCNVLAVEYNASVANTNASFINVSARIPAVGAQTAGLLELLVKLKKQDLAQLHVIGHCLGAHVGGIAGDTVHSTVGRITGLDPAGQTFNDASPNERLSIDDADFVDVIHTSGCNNIHRWGDCMGIHIAIGHSDFWPNGGYYQRACRSSGKHHIDDVCNHNVAQDYFLESFSYGTDTTLFLARPDDTYEHFCISVQCGDFPQYMGINARKVNQKLEYFLNTSVQAPFAELDRSCPSLLSWHLIKGSTITAIVLLAIGLLLVVLPVVVLFISCVKNNFIVQAVPFSSFGEHGTPPPADYYSSRNQSYGVRRTGGIGNSSLIGREGRLTDPVGASPNVAAERSIVSRNNWSPLASGRRVGQHSIRDYGGGGDEVLLVSGGEVLSDEEFLDCSASGIDQPARSPLDRCRLILRKEPVDHHGEQPEDDGLGDDSDHLPTALQHLP